jgi:hypothetical protein
VSHAAADGIDGQIAALSAAVGELKSRLSEQEKTEKTRSAGPARTERIAARDQPDPEPPSDWSEADDDVLAEERRAAADSWYQDQLTLLGQTFDSQGADPNWEADVQARTVAAFSDVGGDLELASMSCGAAMCRLEARMIGDGANVRVDEVLNGKMVWEGESMTRVDESTGEVTVFLMRDGVEMPFVEGPEPRS